MSTAQQSKAAADVHMTELTPEHPNAEAIKSLSTLIGFLKLNPQLPTVSYVQVHVGDEYGIRGRLNGREELAALATALVAGGYDVEEAADPHYVTIRAELPGRVRISASCPPTVLGAPEATRPLYKRVLEVCPHCAGRGWVQTGVEDREPCFTCEERGFLLPEPEIKLPVGPLAHFDDAGF